MSFTNQIVAPIGAEFYKSVDEGFSTTGVGWTTSFAMPDGSIPITREEYQSFKDREKESRSELFIAAAQGREAYEEARTNQLAVKYIPDEVQKVELGEDA